MEFSGIDDLWRNLFEAKCSKITGELFTETFVRHDQSSWRDIADPLSGNPMCSPVFAPALRPALSPNIDYQLAELIHQHLVAGVDKDRCP